MKRVTKILEKKKSSNFNKKEKKLIAKIKNGGLSKSFQKKYAKLSSKSYQGLLTEEEHKELLKLIPISEQWAFERTKLLIELSNLWKTSVDNVLKRLKIKPRSFTYA